MNANIEHPTSNIEHRMKCKGIAILAAAMLLVGQAVFAQAVGKARVKVVSIDGKSPAAEQKFRFGIYSTHDGVDFTGGNWSERLPLPLKEIPGGVQKAQGVITMNPALKEAARVKVSVE